MFFKWRRGRRKTTEEKGPGLNTIPDDHCGESESSTEEIDFDEFSDALSHTHTEACSLSMVSDINSVDDDQGSVHAESRRSFIMDRFLPAAKAMAASESSAQRTQAAKPIIPIFYAVKPSTLRDAVDGKGTFDASLRTLEGETITDCHTRLPNPRYDTKTVNKWRKGKLI